MAKYVGKRVVPNDNVSSLERNQFSLSGTDTSTRCIIRHFILYNGESSQFKRRQSDIAIKGSETSFVQVILLLEICNRTIIYGKVGIDSFDCFCQIVRADYFQQ